MMEDALWREAPGAAPTSIDVHTSLGVTRAYRWAGDGTPIVFLHGGGMTSVCWAPYAETLSRRDVYAVDIMGDAGRSEPVAWISCAADFAVWLDETLAGLGVERAHLVGHSLGGFVALSTAAYRPDRVSSLVLLDPAGIAPINMLRFMAWGFPVLLGSLAPARGSPLARPTTAKPHARKQACLAPAVARHGPSRTRLSTAQTTE